MTGAGKTSATVTAKPASDSAAAIEARVREMVLVTKCPRLRGSPTRRLRTFRCKCHARRPYQPLQAQPAYDSKGRECRRIIGCWQGWLVVPAYAARMQLMDSRGGWVQVMSRRRPSSAASRATRPRLRSAHRPETRSARRLRTEMADMGAVRNTCIRQS